MTLELDGPLDAWSVLVGGLLVLIALGTLVGQPWRYSDGSLVFVLNVVGIVSAVEIGSALVFLAVR